MRVRIFTDDQNNWENWLVSPLVSLPLFPLSLPLCLSLSFFSSHYPSLLRFTSMYCRRLTSQLLFFLAPLFISISRVLYQFHSKSPSLLLHIFFLSSFVGFQFNEVSSLRKLLEVSSRVLITTIDEALALSTAHNRRFGLPSNNRIT